MRLLFLLAIPALTGCATIVTGASKAVNVTSEPSGAIVSIQGKTVRTPGTILLTRHWGNDGSGYIRFEEESSPVFVGSSFEPWMLGNILLGGVVGIIIDLSTGACRDYPDVVHFVQASDGTWAVPEPPKKKRKPAKFLSDEYDEF